MSGKAFRLLDPLKLLLVVSVLLPVAIIGAVGQMTWRDTGRTAESELIRTVDGAAEYADRVLGTFVLTARLADQMLAGLSDEEIRAQEDALHERLKSLVASTPMANTVVLSDRDAILLLSAAVSPVPRMSVDDREWVRALRRPDAPEVHISGVTTGRVAGNLFFGVSIRRQGALEGEPPGTFEGVVTVSVNPGVLSAGLEKITRHPEDVISLIRTDGEVLIRNPGFTSRLPPIPPNSRLHAAADAGVDRGLYDGQSLGAGPNRPAGAPLMIAFRRVGNLPIYVTVSRPRAVIAAGWFATMLPLVALGLPATIMLLLLTMLVRRGQRRLAAGEAEFRAAFESGAIGNALVDATTGRFLRVNRMFCEITRYARDDLRARIRFHDLAVAGVRGGRELRQVASQAGETPHETERWRRADGTEIWVQLDVARVSYEGNGASPLVIAAVQDISERKASEERQSLLAREVDHRAKNTLAVVQALVRLSRAGDVKALAKAIEGRISALARAHELLAKDRWRGSELRSVIQEELAAFAESAQLTLSGPSLRLDADSVQPFSMAVHELATNAAKHGALSRSGGAIEIAWRHAADSGMVELEWCERGGPAVTAPADRQGFGLTILKSSVRQLGGEVTLDWNTSGLRCVFTVTTRAIGACVEAATVAGNDRRQDPQAGPGQLGGRRILLVEDEAIVAIDMAGALASFGCEVLGPAASVEAGMLLASGAMSGDGGLDAAVLDMNLAGETSIPLARYLADNGVPFIYATGYSDMGDGAPGAPMLRKPVAPADLEAALLRTLGLMHDHADA